MVARLREETFLMSTVRKMHQVNLAPWGLPDMSGFWFQWNHPGEQSPSLFDVIQRYVVQNNWAQFIPTGGVCIDIGGYTGDTAVPMAVMAYDRVLRKRARVIVVEPNPFAFEVLRLTLAVNGHLGDFSAVRAAITKEDGVEVEIADHGNQNCNGGIIDTAYSPYLQQLLQSSVGGVVKAPGLTLETLCQTHLSDEEMARISFIKTDCEGYDKEILKASADFIDRHRPTMFVEWFQMFTPEDSESLFEIVSGLDYVPFNPQTLQPASKDAFIEDLLLIHRSRLPQD